MKIRIIAIGEPKKSFARDGIAEYLKRLQGFEQAEIVYVKENKQTESKILELVKGWFVVLMDETGKEYSSAKLAEFLDNKNSAGQSSLAFVIGGADGHTLAIRDRADSSLALSQLTLPHELALLFVVEALYRAVSINAGHPYHRV